MVAVPQHDLRSAEVKMASRIHFDAAASCPQTFSHRRRQVLRDGAVQMRNGIHPNAFPHEALWRVVEFNACQRWKPHCAQAMSPAFWPNR